MARVLVDSTELVVPEMGIVLEAKEAVETDALSFCSFLVTFSRSRAILWQAEFASATLPGSNG
jgi:hypothetical protein